MCDTWRAVGEALATRAKLVRLFTELKRRKVFKIMVAYLVVAGGLIGVASDIEGTPELMLPEHLVFWVVVGTIIGVPITFALSWRYDLLPKTTEALETEMAREALAGAKTGRGEGQPAAVVVLPFDNLTPSTPHAYLANAIPIELQSILSRMHDLRVVSRQSAAAGSIAHTDLKTIAKNLAVQYVISGSLTDLGDRLQINVQLDDALDDTLLWSERYDVATKDVERLQHEISEKVVGMFGGERMRAEIGRANKMAPSAQPTAWQLVQQARSYLIDYTPASIAASIPLLRRAIELDPQYSIAYATLGLLTAEKTLNALSADAAADRRSAIDTIARAERLAPRDPVVLRTAGIVYAYTGDYRRSIELLRRAVKLAPYDLGTWGYLGWPLVATGQAQDLAEVHEIVDRLLATAGQHPGRAYWVFHKSVAYTCAGECERALAHAEEYTVEQPRFSVGWLHYVNVLGRLGRVAEARAALEQSLTNNPLMKPAYYLKLMSVLTDQEGVIRSRTEGLRQAGLVETPS